MRPAEASRRKPPARSPLLEDLEPRRLRAGITSTSVFVTQAYSQLMDDLKKMELNSRATPAEYLALRDDARALSAATSSDAPNAPAEAALVSTILDRSTIDGGLNATQWADVQSRLQAALVNLGVGQPLIDQTLADMQAIAASARVTPSEYQQFNKDFTSLSTAETIPGNLSYMDTNPSLYFAQHLGGFFRGWAVQRTTDVATLKADLRTLPAENGASPSQAATVKRDAGLLEKLGAKLPSQDESAFLGTYAAIVAQPSVSEQSTEPFEAGLGTKITRSQAADVKKLIDDAPTFAHALGQSSANVQTITQDVQAVVNDGVSGAPNPFKVTVS